MVGHSDGWARTYSIRAKIDPQVELEAPVCMHSVMHVINAEIAGAFVVVNQEYVEVPNHTGNGGTQEAELKIKIICDSDVHIQFEGEVYAPSAVDDSFHVQFDSGDTFDWHTGRHQGW